MILKEESQKNFLKRKKIERKASGFVGDLPVKVGDIISFPVFQIHSLVME
ncbi:MAG: hypothetical protein CM1200mP28_10750 [Deltaproteobacteria bacterium]|nr:MAG: hypothetical protein CM1200mP28_10750 [Deltaproteobacteria bacterium]